MIKLIASDIDGTLLLNGKRTLSEELFEQIRELRKHHILFVAASGRQVANLRRLFEPVADEIAYIAENGAYVVYQGKVISKTPIPREIGLEILKSIRQRENCEILLSGEQTSYLEPKTAEYEEHMKFFVKNNVTIVPDILQVQEDFLKISVYEKDGIEQSQSFFEDKWSDQVKVVTSGYKWLDMVNLNVNKGTAIQMLMNRLDITPHETVAFGDHYNDVEMLQSVFYSYAMKSAQPGIAMHCFDEANTVEEVIRDLLAGL